MTKIDSDLPVFGEKVSLPEATKERKRLEYQENREENAKEHAEYQRVWRKRDPASHKISKLKYRYGINKVQQDYLLVGRETCDCCETTEPGHKGWVIDHDHITLKVRGVLCDSCNVGISRLKDDPIILFKAINYLQIKAPATYLELNKLK